VGPLGLPWVVFGAAVLALAGALAARRPLTAATALPFGPALAAATWLLFLLLAWGSGQLA
jgi:prepilin signal peptidase PulO-like enzyme (type II secretory pathway)